MHRGTKEMDLLLGNFVKKYIDEFNDNELKDLEKLLFIEDEIIYKWYFEKKNNIIPNNKSINNCLKILNYNLWRRGWDSNPRMSCPIAGFQDQCFQPLSHLKN